MPTYDYACAACGHRFEVVHGVHQPGPDACPACAAGPVRKAIAAPTVVFKGSGWAKVDRRSSQAASKKDSKPSSDEGGAKPSDGGGGDATKTSPKPEAGSTPAAAKTD